MALAPSPDMLTPAADVERLVVAQFPALTGLPVTPAPSGWDNDLFRLGDSLVVRIPRRKAAVERLRNEIAWLPVVGELVDVPIPQPVLVGTPTATFPWPWMVCHWQAGTPASELDIADRGGLAEPLADFLWALHVPASHRAPVNPLRGGSLATEEPNRRAGERLDRWAARNSRMTAAALRARWESWTAAPDHEGVDVWVHGDLHPYNILADTSGSLASVIDWGDLTPGDPACDLATAWLTFDADGRRAFQARYDQGRIPDPPLWTRAKAWALHVGLILADGSDDQPHLREVGEATLQALLNEPV